MRELDQARVLERLRGNLGDAGIAVSEEDFAGLGERGFLNAVLAFEAALRGEDAAALPDPLEIQAPKDREPGASPPPLPTPAPRAGPPPSPAELLEGGILEAQARLRSGEVSARELLLASLEGVRSRGAELGAFHFLREEEVLREADRADEELRKGEARSLLHGIPLAVKDIYDLKGLPTRAGSRILDQVPAPADSLLLSRLRAAGALIVGKTSLPEFSFSPASNNEHFGPTKNPHDPSRDSGGSSAGSAAAVADHLVFAALGSDSGGSIRIPASFCGIVGWKPALGWAGLGGALRLSWSLDTAGCLARSVEDAVLLARLLAEPERLATVGPAEPGRLRAFELGGLRIGAIRGEGRGRALAEPEVLSAWEGGLEILRARGARIVDLEVPELPLLRAINSALLSIEAAALHRGFQAERLGDYGDFARLGLLVGWAYGPADHLRARQALGRLRASMLGRFGDIDLLSTPTMTSVASPLGRPPRITFTAPFNALGWPALSLPCGRGEAGLPLGFQLVGRPGDEGRLLAAALALEEGLGSGPP